MLVLGILLILVAVALIVAVLLGANSAPVGFDLQVLEIETTPVGVFVLGALTLLVLMFGLLAIRLGTRKGIQHRRERKELKNYHSQDSDSHGSTGSSDGSPTGSASGSSSDRR